MPRIDTAPPDKLFPWPALIVGIAPTCLMTGIALWALHESRGMAKLDGPIALMEVAAAGLLLLLLVLASAVAGPVAAAILAGRDRVRVLLYSFLGCLLVLALVWAIVSQLHGR